MKPFEFEDLETEAQLSDLGRNRRNAMRQVLERTIATRRQIRVATRFAISAVFVIGIVIGTTQLFQSETAAPLEEPLAFKAQWVTDSPDILKRYLADPVTLPSSIWISDEELVDTLALSGQPTGFIRSGSEFWLTESPEVQSY